MQRIIKSGMSHAMIDTFGIAQNKLLLSPGAITKFKRKKLIWIYREEPDEIMIITDVELRELTSHKRLPKMTKIQDSQILMYNVRNYDLET